MNEGSCIWIVEDSLREVEDSYLAPLERIAATFGDSFPRVLVFAIGLDDDDADKIETLNAERIRRYPLTVPTIEWPQRHERDSEAFIQELRSRVRPNDLVLVDGTVQGRGWQARDDGYQRYVFNALRSNISEDTRVILVTNLTKMDHEGWDEYHPVTLPKNLSGSKDRYDAALKSRLMPSRDWTAGLNEEGKDVLPPYVERLRTAQGRGELEDIGARARALLLESLDPERQPPTSLSEGLKKLPRTYADNLKLRNVLTRRRVIYGLRQLWLQSSPDRDDDDAYLLWLEVVAAGFHWYAAEQTAVKNLPLWAKTCALQGTSTEITLSDAQQFRGKHGLVTKAFVEPIGREIRWEGKSRKIRFIEARVSFRHKGESTGGRPRYHYEMTLPALDGPIPGDGASGPEWDEFWSAQRVPPNSVRCVRRGHIEAIHSGLSHGCHFLNHDMMLRVLLAMDEEVSWWRRVGPDLAKRLADPRIFSARQQSMRRVAADPENGTDEDDAGDA